MNRKMIYGLLLGAALGVICIVGASLRMPGELSTLYLFSFWYNRVLMGLVIALFPKPKSLKVSLLRGAILGMVISFAFYSATEFNDLMGFIAGIVYGMIIEVVLFTTVKD